MEARDRALLVGAVEARLGLHLQSGLHDLLTRQAMVLIAEGAAASAEELARRVLVAGEDDGALARLRQAASIGETWFFRGQPQLERLIEEVRTARNAARRRGPLRVWSAGCSTGEEPYSIAALFSAAFPGAAVEVLATDMNERSLEHATRGVYGPRCFRGAGDPPGDAFRPHPEGFEVAAKLRARVRLIRHNLALDPAPGQQFDAVVCRNVLMYLDPTRIPAVIARLFGASASPGLLLLTAAEASAGRVGGLRALGGGLFTRGAIVEPSSPGSRRRAQPTTANPKQVTATAPKPAVVASRPREVSATDPVCRLDEARQLARRGELDAALRVSQQAIATRPGDAEAHTLVGTILLAGGALEAAAAALGRAVCLDEADEAAQLLLAQTSASLNRPLESARHARRALRLLAAFEEEAQVEGLGITAAAARKIAESLLEEPRR